MDTARRTFCNLERLWEQLLAANVHFGRRCWLPFWPGWDRHFCFLGSLGSQIAHAAAPVIKKCPNICPRCQKLNILELGGGISDVEKQGVFFARNSCDQTLFRAFILAFHLFNAVFQLFDKIQFFLFRQVI